jgi:UDP-GlcNAc:undecaprenyl-phosphate/decaprenyl-phosphate GlcNAc-1-phosphate transferase
MVVLLFLLTAVSLMLSLSLTPIVRILAFRWNLVDLPDNKRKIHKNPIPRIGGVPLAAAYFGSCIAVAAFLAHSWPGAPAGFAAMRSIAPAAMLIFLIGLADDVFGLKPWHKLAVEILAAAVVIWAGVRVHNISAFSVHPVLGVLGTILWLVACTNALNLIDGMDGLAAGIALVATTTVLIGSLLSGSTELTVITAPMVGALLGFLVFNFNPASIFLGDSGSLVLGFLLGCFGILWTRKSVTLADMAAPLIALAIPLLDTVLSIFRRFLRAQPIFKPDRSHIHHRLLALGLSQRQAVLLLYLAAGAAGALSLCLILGRNHWEILIIVTFACGVIFGIRQLGYVEFEAARRLIVRGGFRRALNAQLAVQTFEQKLLAADTPEDCWAVIQRASEEFGFRPTQMQLAGQVFGHKNGDGFLPAWAIRILISQADWIELFHELAPVGDTTAAVSFADTIRKVLAEKAQKNFTLADVDGQTAA